MGRLLLNYVLSDPYVHVALIGGHEACLSEPRFVELNNETLLNLLTQGDQVRCFENVAAHLADDGSFVVEAFVMSIG